MNYLPVEARSYGALAMVPFDQGTVKQLTKVDKFGNEYKLYEHEVGQPYMSIPRGLINRATVPPERLFLFNSPVPQSIALKPPRNQDQANCIAHSVALLHQDQDHIVEAPTGFGKSYVGAAVAGYLGQKTLIVVTKNDLVTSWRDTLIKLMGVPPHEIGHVQQDKCVYEGCRFVIGMVHSLIIPEKYPADFFKQFGLVMFDEVHRLGAEYFSQVCKLFPSRHRLGLSATPKRSDGREGLFKAHIGPVAVVGSWIPMEPTILVKKTGWKVPKVKQMCDGEWVTAPMKVVPGKMASVVKAMGKDLARNGQIVEFVKAAYEKDRRTLILSEQIENHLVPLFHLLVAAGIPGEEIGYYIGKMKAHELEVSKNRKVVLATYMFTAEGTDVPQWDTLVMATPRANVKQPVGRVIRYVEGKKKPVILDLVDDNAVLQNFHFTRMKQYYQLKAEIVGV